MKPKARELRRIARVNQNKHYWWAVLVTLVAMVLGGTVFAIGTTQPQLNVSFSFGGMLPMQELEEILAESFGYNTYDVELQQIMHIVRLLTPIVAALLVIGSISALFGLAAIVLAGPMRYGYSRYCLQMYDAEPRSHFGVLFSGFKHFGKALGLYWWIFLKIFLWGLFVIAGVVVATVLVVVIAGVSIASNSALWEAAGTEAFWGLLPTIILLIVIEFVLIMVSLLPAVIAEYRYSMAYYLMIENPALGIREAVCRSTELMHGNKWRLFCLHFSFIGWNILNGLTFGILGLLFLNPYHEYAVAAFYRSLVPAQPVSRLWNDDPACAPQPSSGQSGAAQAEVPSDTPAVSPAAMPGEAPVESAVWEGSALPEQEPSVEPVPAADDGPDPDGNELPPQNPWLGQ